jgi:anti-sigma regulatory factor (Ser/Thr protein kinase)
MSAGQPGGEPPARRPQARHAAGSPARAESLLPAMPSWARVFPGTPQQVGATRRFVAALLDGSPFREDAVLVVSELVTNALLHSRSGHPGGLVTVQVTRWLLGVRIAVTDQGSPNRPVIRDTGPGRQMAESGHSPSTSTGTTTPPAALSTPSSAQARLSTAAISRTASPRARPLPRA